MARDFQQAHDILIDMMCRPGGAIEWSNAHSSWFEYSKLALMDFTHRNSKKTQSPLTLLSSTVKLSESTKYLGAYLDHTAGIFQCNPIQLAIS